MPRLHLPRFTRRPSAPAPGRPAGGLGRGLGAGGPGGRELARTAGAGDHGIVVLTNASNGTSSVVAKGDLVVVKLASEGYRWTEASVVNASPEAVLQKESGRMFHDGSSVTTFLVVGYGDAALQARGRSKVHRLGLRHGRGAVAGLRRLAGGRSAGTGRRLTANGSGHRTPRAPRPSGPPRA